MKTIFQSPSKWIYLVTLLLFTVVVSAQEICDNGIDDDGDGLIDINDQEDCYCGAVSIDIVNGDFEDHSCCPDNVTFLPDNGIYCLIDGWEPASGGTSDYYNTCDFIGGGIVPTIPLPMPSGEGAVGFFNTVNYQESVGVCFDNPMLSGETYDLSFYIGFHSNTSINSPLDVDLIVYGTPTCDDFPVTGFSCLDGLGQWEEIAVIPVSGTMDSSWLYVESSFIPNFNVAAIAFSTECVSATQYHFFDDVTVTGPFLEEESGDEIVMTGDCINGVQLEVPFDGGSTYQWYLDGIAIAGATSSTYLIPNADDEGVYQVVVDNGSFCSLSPPLDVIIDANVLDINGAITDVQCISNDDGSIDLDIDSPNMPFDIEWSNSEVIEDISGLSSGTYSVTVTDDNGCYGDETFQVIDPPTVTAMVMGDCNTGVEVSVSEINPGETYQWYYFGFLVPGATSSSYLVPTDEQGEYYVVISNGASCFTSDPIDAYFDTSILDIVGIVNHVLCFGDETGWIDIEIENDNDPYQYEWSNGWLGQDIYDLGVGMYTVTVSDDYGCSGTATYTVDQPTTFFSFANVVQPVGNEGGQATIVSNGGIQPYVYAWSNGNDTDSDSDLPPGIYTVIVTDANGCEEIVIFSIEGNFSVIEAIVSAGCNNECNGTVSLDIDGPPVIYNIEWADSQYQGFDLTGLCAGSYPYTVSDDDGAAFDGVVLISQYDSIEIEAFYIDTLCSIMDSIEISTITTGGTSPYTYLWSTASINDSLFDITIGMYALTVTDSNLCSDSISIEIAQNVQPVISSNIILAGCDGEDTGAIDLIVSNVEEPVTYLWSNGMMTEDISELTIGDYDIVITDGNGCQYNESYTIGANTGFVVNEIIVDVNCIDDNDGMISLDIQNGIEPYMINWSHGPMTATIDNLIPAEYSVDISDASGCSGSFTYTVELLTSMNVDAVVENNLCADQTSGSIALTIDAGGNGYSVLWNDDSVDELRENLTAGNYELEITDEFGCIYNYDYEVLDLGEPILSEFVIVPDTCGSGGVGSIELIPLGGAMPFSYLWEDDSESTSLENLEGGIYTVTITNNNDCEIIEEAIVTSVSDLEVSLTTTPITCAGSSTASATLIPIGAEPYEYLWSNNATTATISELSPDISFAYTVTDGNGCVGVGSIMFEDSLMTLEIIELVVPPLCNGDEGSISITVEGGMTPYEYLWSTSSMMNTIQVISGSYEVTVTDILGCTASSIINIHEPGPLNLSLVSITNPTSTNDDGSIEIAIDGGTEPYTTLWSNGASSTSINGLSQGDYSVIVTDVNGCTDSLSFTLMIDVTLSAMYSMTSNPCFGDCLGSITAEPMGGIEPYTYLWSDGSQFDSITDLCIGEYQVEITDAGGNSMQSEIFTIASPDDIIIDGIVYDISCLDAQDGSITLDVLGGTSPFQFSWDNSAQGDSISELASGSYEVITMDNNGCSETATFTIDDIPIISIQSSLLPLDCGDEDYTIEIIGDNEYNYPFIINNEIVTPNEDNQISGLLAGEYSLSYLINENCEVNIIDFSLEPIEEYELSISTQELLVEQGELITLFLDIDNETNLTDYSITWNAINNYDCVSLTNIGECISIELLANTAENITVLFADRYGCETELTIELRLKDIIPEIFIPNIFSPNGDGSNDEFIIQSNDDLTILQSINIFDRWGNLLFVQEDVLLNQAKNWNGDYNGTSVNPGVYIYVVEVLLNDTVEIYYGDLTVIR